MKKLVNTTATADVGYVEKLPYRAPPPELERQVVERVQHIVEVLKQDPAADIDSARADIDELIFDLFEIRSAREEIRGFYRRVGRTKTPAQAASE